MTGGKGQHMRKKPQLSPEGLALVLVLATQRLSLVCPACHQAVADIQPHGAWFMRVPGGHRVQTDPTDA